MVKTNRKFEQNVEKYGRVVNGCWSSNEGKVEYANIRDRKVGSKHRKVYQSNFEAKKSSARSIGNKDKARIKIARELTNYYQIAAADNKKL